MSLVSCCEMYKYGTEKNQHNMCKQINCIARSYHFCMSLFHTFPLCAAPEVPLVSTTMQFPYLSRRVHMQS